MSHHFDTATAGEDLRIDVCDFIYFTAVQAFDVHRAIVGVARKGAEGDHFGQHWASSFGEPHTELLKSRTIAPSASLGRLYRT